jgi:5-methylcytosine-specific restriction protein B
MFSPKVLDRANVIEFRVSDEEMKSFLGNPVKPNLDAIAGQGVQYAKAFVAAATQKDVPLDEELKTQISGVLMAFFPQLKDAGAEFGYRTAHEICRFVYFHKELSSDDWKFEAAMDAAIMQKLLPKLHGSKKKLGPVLHALISLCLKEGFKPEKDPVEDKELVETNARYWNSLEKLKRMRKRLQENGFTSFAEA